MILSSSIPPSTRYRLASRPRCCQSPRSRCHSKQNLKRSLHRNQQYSITAISDGSSAVIERYAYSAYGTPTITDASGTTRTTTAIGNRYTYTGREWDETLSLYHYRARMYDSVGGRFCSRDPIGFVDGYLLYRAYFVVKGGDPMGLSWWNPIPEIGACLFDGCDVATEEILEHYFDGNGAPYEIPAVGLGIIFNQASGDASSEIAEALEAATEECDGPNDSYTVGGAFDLSQNFTGTPGLFTLGDTVLRVSFNCTVQCDCAHPCYSCTVDMSVDDQFEDAVDIWDWIDSFDIDLPGSQTFPMTGHVSGTIETSCL